MTLIRALGLYWSITVLNRLAASKDRLSFSELYRACRASPSMLTKTLRSLAEVELIEVDPFDGYAITPAGTKAIWVVGELLSMAQAGLGQGASSRQSASNPGTRIYTSEGDQRRRGED